MGFIPSCPTMLGQPRPTPCRPNNQSDPLSPIHPRPANPPPIPSVDDIVRDFERRFPGRQRQNLVFWTGVGTDGAQQFADRHDRYTLNELIHENGNINGRDVYADITGRPWAQGGQQVWEQLSLALAQFAEGVVYVVQTDAGRQNPNSIWARIERPRLQERHITIRYFNEQGNEVDEHGRIKRKHDQLKKLALKGKAKPKDKAKAKASGTTSTSDKKPHNKSTAKESSGVTKATRPSATSNRVQLLRGLKRGLRAQHLAVRELEMETLRARDAVRSGAGSEWQIAFM